jgi:hypothetical protein
MSNPVWTGPRDDKTAIWRELKLRAVMTHLGLWLWWVEGICSGEINTGARAMAAAEAAARRYVEG